MRALLNIHFDANFAHFYSTPRIKGIFITCPMMFGACLTGYILVISMFNQCEEIHRVKFVCIMATRIVSDMFYSEESMNFVGYSVYMCERGREKKRIGSTKGICRVQDVLAKSGIWLLSV